MCSNHETLLLQLLKMQLTGEKIKDQSFAALNDSDWETIYDEASQHSITALVSDSISKLPECIRPSQSLRGHYEQMCMRCFFRYYDFLNFLTDVLDIFEKKGIRAIVLKGIGLSRLYAKPELRQMCDLDLYVGEEQYEQARNALLEYGLQLQKREGIEYHEDFVYAKEEYSIHLELHSEIVGSFGSAELDSDIAAHFSDLSACTEPFEFDQISICVLRPEWNAFYLLLHMAKHFATCGFGLRQLCDWATFLRHYGTSLSLEQLVERTDAVGLTPFLFALTAACEKHLGLSQLDCPWNASAQQDHEVVDLLIDDILQSGNFGKKERSRMMNLSFEASRKENQSPKFKNHFLFEYVKRTVKEQYPVCEKWKVLFSFFLVCIGVQFFYNNVTKRKTTISQVVESYRQRTSLFESLDFMEKM